MNMPHGRALTRLLLAIGMMVIGVAHFLTAPSFARIVPSALPYPLALVYISGVAEVAGGVGLLIPRLRRWAGWGLVALYVCVFPANVNMAINNIQPEGATIPVWLLWARLPLQIFLIWLALVASRPDSPMAPTPANAP